MENLLKDLSSLLKLPNDSKVQLKAISILNDILETMKKLEKKKLTDSQVNVEESLYNYIINQRANSDICNRYIYYIYKYMFDFGLSSRLNEFITKYSSAISSSKTSVNLKGTALWILGKVCCKANYKSPQLIELINLLIKTIKNTTDILIKNESFSTLCRLLHLKLPNFYNQINDIMKIILKQEKYFQTEVKCKKNILKSLDAALFFLNQIAVAAQYENIVSFLTKCFEDEDSTIRKISTSIYLNLHIDKVFDQSINLQKIVRKKPNEQLKNFLEILLYFGNIFASTKSDIHMSSNLNLKICYIQILKNLFEKNMDFINSSESLITKIFDLLISYFQLNYVGFLSNNLINYKQNLTNLNNPGLQVSITSSTAQYSNQNKLNCEIEELYRGYIKIIFHSSYRRTLLKHIFKRLNDSQNDLDKMENLSINVNKDAGGGVDKKSTTLNSNSESNSTKKKKEEREKYTEFHVNSMLLSLIEFSENNYDLLEITFKNFQDISQNLVVYLISSVKSFRQLINRVFINMAYFIPSWRIQILTLILNLTSVAHAEVAALKNTFIYFVDENNSEYKYALIIRNNLDLLKDISNCLGIVLSTFSHKNTGVTVDMSNAALSIAKNMIIGKFADEEDNPKSLSLKEKTTKFNYSNSDVDAHKEAGWTIIQGLASMDYTWLTNNFKTLFQLWKYVFSDHCCTVDESELQKPEYREALISEFYIKKAAIASLRKFILASCDFINSQTFQLLIPKFLNNALAFFIPNDKKKVVFFYKTILKEKYKEAKGYLYDCYYSIPIKLYSSKFNQLLLPACDEITSNEYLEYSTDFIYTNINYFDTFMCNNSAGGITGIISAGNSKNNISNSSTSHFNNQIPDNTLNLNSNNIFQLDNFNIEKFNISMTDRLNTEVNSKLVDSSVNLIVDILLENSLNVKNRQLIFKHFLTHMSEISMKQTDKQKINKAVNIVYTLYLILKKSAGRNIYIINDESIFASSKMIFDIGFKIDNALTRRISAEGHSLLIQVSSNPPDNINYYLTAMECKFKNESNIDNQHFINTFYMIANIFRNNKFSDIQPYLDLYMNFIISYFNRIEDLFNPFISQSIYIITEVLIKNNQIDHSRKMIEVYKLNYLFINKDNTVFFKDMMERNSFSEIRLMILLVMLGENIKQSEIEILKLILNKYMMDEKYKSKKIKKVFLYFAKVILKEHNKLKELVHNSAFLQFLMNNINDDSAPALMISNYTNDVLNFNIDSKFSIEILIFYLLSMDSKNIEIFKEFCEKLINTLNNFYYSVRYFYFNNSIINFTFKLPPIDDLLFDKNSDDNLIKLCRFIDLDNKNLNNFEKPKNLIFDFIYINFHVIKLIKLFLKIYFEKKFSNFSQILNLMKDLIQNQLALYTSSTANSNKVVKADSLTKSEETKEETNSNKSLLVIRKVSKSMHISVKKFLIKSLKHCLYITLSNLNTGSISNMKPQNSTVLLEFLNYFMNSSMLLISCEECWEIKVKGVDLLLEIIKRFSKLKDNRTDDDSLLIQQYEAQISSCVKTIFTNTFSITALFKGMNLLYHYLSIPITTDLNYIKKVNNLVDINLRDTSSSSSSNSLGAFSEKYDHILICKKLNFFCKMYLSTVRANSVANIKNKKSRNNFNEEFFNIIDVINSKISRWQVHYENLPQPENLVEFFNSNFDLFFINLFNMLNDLFIILTQDRKFLKNYKNFEFLTSGNRICYSHKKVLKYGQFYLKILGYLVNDSKFMNENPKNKILYKINLNSYINGLNHQDNKNSSNQMISTMNSQPVDNKIHSDFNFDNIFYLIFYYLNYFTIKKLQSENDYKKTEYVIYSEDDVTDDLKEKIILNNILVNELIEVMLNFLTNSSNVVSINKITFFEILKTTLNLFSLSIEEVDIKLFSIIECLLSKWQLKISNGEGEDFNNYNKFTNDENIFLIDNISKLIYFYFNNKLGKVYGDSGMASGTSSNTGTLETQLIMKIIEIANFNISNILNIFLNMKNTYNDSSINVKLLEEYFYHCFKIIFSIFSETLNPNLSKICAAKIFPLLNKIDNIQHLKLILPLFKHTLEHSKQFEKFFLIFYMILQYGSKKFSNENSEFSQGQLENKFNLEISNFISNHILHELYPNKEESFLLLIFKSFILGVSQNFDPFLKLNIENLIFYLIDEKIIFNYFGKSDDIQNLIISFILSTEDVERRRMMINLIILIINDNLQFVGLDTLRLCVFILKIISKDFEFLKDIAGNLEIGLVANLESLIKIQQAQQAKAKEEKKLENSQMEKTSSNYNASASDNANNKIKGSNSNSIENGNSNILNQINENQNSNLTNNSTGGPKLKALKFKK